VKSVFVMLCAVTVFIIANLAGGGTADALVLGGKWPRSGVFTLYFNYGGSHRYYGNVWQGATNWSNTPTNVNVAFWSGLPNPIHIDVIDTYTNDTWWGLTTWSPCSSCAYTKNTYYLNQRTLDPESDFTRTKVATHEFGHTIGLAHAPYNTTSVMNQGYLSYNTPQQYDVNDLNSLYK
jgi:Matrixin